ncbi:DoxX family protein [Salinimicrobium tongyeongense]|uniref:DoxX family protein n=1 Tax=Salinimicrobium tongyeongense TaxID=2809707 RepID=A0ABY6NQY4_9FLAO|nr:DoxX family protein [Salinimicrobium tongyeongense]UZH54961.1 DoxX family protein [Salinimicrobium tongyeongense]
MTTTNLVSSRSVQLFRVMLSGIFLVASSSHLLRLEQTLRRIEEAHFKGIAYFFGEPSFMVIASGIVMLLAGISLFIGFRTRWAALILLVVLIPITLTIQVGQITTLGPLFKNIAIMGGLIFFIINDFNKPKKTNHEKYFL